MEKLGGKNGLLSRPKLSDANSPDIKNRDEDENEPDGVVLKRASFGRSMDRFKDETEPRRWALEPARRLADIE